MRMRPEKIVKMYGQPEIGISRYFALYLAQLGWIVLGIFLYSRAYWPSTCQPDTLVKIYSCSALLPDSRNWVETALFTWLWSTPMLAGLELSRRLSKPKRR